VKALVVGAGAVGQVYARHLGIGGAEVAFLVKPRHAEAARRGFDLYPLDRPDPRREPVRLEGSGVLTSPDEAAGAGFDLVLLCVSSTALRAGDGAWLAALARATGEATVVVLQPGIEDRDFAAARVAEGRLVTGLIGMVSYQAPLPGEVVPRPGVAYWWPPLAATPLCGPPERARPVSEALGRGGLRAPVQPDLARTAATGNAILGSHVAALEAADWRFEALRRDRDLLRLATRASREALAVSARRIGFKPPLAAFLVRPCLASLVIRLAPRVAPLDIETYFRVHFTKVGDQMRLGMRTAIELAERYGLEATALRELAARRSPAAPPSLVKAGRP